MKKQTTPPAPLDFETVLRLRQNELKQALAQQLAASGYAPISKKGYLYAVGEIPVLLVAHLDTVHREPVADICYSAGNRLVMSPQGIGGDDRCGVWMILQIIRRARCSVLFCEDEEIGCVGARRFTESRHRPRVNYLVELDRRGCNDAVFYQCANPAFTDFVLRFGFELEYGTCSDISYLAPHLGAAAVNLSSGYYNEHRLHEVIHLEEMQANILRVTEMVLTETQAFPYMEYQPKQTTDRIPMMKLPPNATVLLSGHIMPQAEYYMDKQDSIHRYLPILDAAVRTELAEAYDETGRRCQYSAKLTTNLKGIRVISYSEAAEQLLQIT